MSRRPKLVAIDHDQLEHIAEVERWRGGIDQMLNNLVGATEGLKNEIKEERAEAIKHYAGVTQVIGALSTSVGTLSEYVKEMRPIVTVLEANRLRAQGVVWGLRALWLTLGGVAGAVIARLVH